MKATLKLAPPVKTSRDALSLETLKDMAWAVIDFLALVKRALDQTGRYVQTVRTTDATVTEIWAHPMPLNCCWTMDIDVLGHSTAGQSAAYKRLSRFERLAGNAVLLGTDTLGTDREAVAAWDVTIDANVEKARVRVTGGAATTIDWAIRVALQEARAA